MFTFAAPTLTQRLTLMLIAMNFAISGYIAAHHLEPFADLATYYQEAQNVAEGRGLSLDIKIVVNSPHTQAPFPVGDRLLYPLLVAPLLKLFGDSLAVANVVSALAMALIAWPLYLIGKWCWHERIGLLAAVLFTINPFYHHIGIGAWTDLLATLFYYASLACLIRYALLANHDSPRPAHVSHFTLHVSWSTRLAFLAGLFFALATLTREDAIVLSLVLLGAWWLGGRNRVHALAFALMPLSAFVGRGVYLWWNFGSPLHHERPYFLLPRWALWYYLGSFSLADYLDYVGGINGAIAIRLYNYARFVENLFSDGVLYFTQTGLMPAFMLIALVAAFRWPLTPTRRHLLWLCAGAVLLQGVLGIGYPGYAGNSTEVRHGQLIAPFLLLLVAVGLMQLWQQRRWQRWLAIGLSGLYIVFTVAYLGAWGQTLLQPSYRGPIVLAAEWARTHLPLDAILMTRRAAETHYFSGRVVIATPSAPFTELMAFAQTHRVSHFLITDVERSGAPNLLQGIRAYPQYFSVVYSATDAQIIAVKEYSFVSHLQPLPNELYAGKTIGRPAQLYDWGRLRPEGAGEIVAYLSSSWRDIFNRWRDPPISPAPRGAWLNLTAGDGITLMRYDIADGTPARGTELYVTLHWQNLAPQKTNYTVFVHLLDESGALRAQKDAPPLNNTRPTSVWVLGEWVEDAYAISLPETLAPGAYKLAVGMYDGATGARLPLRDRAGNRLSDDRWLIEGIVIR